MQAGGGAQPESPKPAPVALVCDNAPTATAATSSSGQTVDGVLCELRLCLSVLENATFTCNENEDEMLRLQVRAGLG